MAALCAATAIIAVVVPFAAGLSLLGTVPMGLLAYRYRLRVLITATVAGGIIAFLIAGMGGFMTVVNCAYIGGLTGIVKRRGRGTPTVLGVRRGRGGGVRRRRRDGAGGARAAAPPDLRVGDRQHQRPRGGDRAHSEHATGRPIRLKRDFATALHHWPYLFFASSVLSIVMVTLIGWWALSRVMTRLLGIPDVHKLESSADTGPIAPVPARLHDVVFRYPNADHDALGPVSMSVEPGEHVAVTGANGSGKTTLMLMLAGREPTSGTIERPGAVGLGRLGGTAVIMQHPESQVLGTRVADDVVWGLPPGKTTDVHQLLTEVGLDGLAERDTGGLSGGELQRLAVAAALAREPSLLIADEVTSMVDQDGRDALMSVLSALTQHHRMSLVHITHYNDEADAADRIVNLTGNGGAADNTEMVETASAPAATAATQSPVRDAGARTERRGPRVRQRNTLGCNGFAGYQFRRPRRRRRADPRSQRFRQVDAGLDHGRPDGADRAAPACSTVPGLRSGWRRGDLVPGRSAAVDAQPGRSGDRLGGRVLAARPRPGGVGAGHASGLDAGAGEAAHRSAQRRPDAPRRAGRPARAITARAHPRRATGRPGRGEPARSAATAGGSAPQRRI